MISIRRFLEQKLLYITDSVVYSLLVNYFLLFHNKNIMIVRRRKSIFDCDRLIILL